MTTALVAHDRLLTDLWAEQVAAYFKVGLQLMGPDGSGDRSRIVEQAPYLPSRIRRIIDQMLDDEANHRAQKYFLDQIFESLNLSGVILMMENPFRVTGVELVEVGRSPMM
jgi:hypothetical protein